MTRCTQHIRRMNHDQCSCLQKKSNEASSKHFFINNSILRLLYQTPQRAEMSTPESIFCCASAMPVQTYASKPYNDPNEGIHDAIFQSFLAFAYRRAREEREASLMALINGNQLSTGCTPPTKKMPVVQALIPQPVLTIETLKNNLITTATPYVIHLVSRHDYGPVCSHRYFVCPPDLRHDWTEASLEQWFAVGEQFKLRADTWDVKCLENSKVSVHGLLLKM